MIGMNFIARHGIKALVALVAIGVVCMVAEPLLGGITIGTKIEVNGGG